MHKAVIYTRVSTKKQEGGYSLRTQEEDCREWCARNDCTVHAVVSDTYSGRDSLSKRPGIQKVLRMFLNREVDTLVVWKIDRSSRSTHDNQRLFDVVSGCDGTHVSAMDGKIENTPDGILMLGIHSYKGEKERADTKARTERGIEARVKQGYILTSAVPLYGYRWAYEIQNHRMRKTIYEIDDEAAETVRGMYKRAAEGWTIRRICRDLNERGVPCPSLYLHLRGELPEGRDLGDHWERNTAYNVLTNESYTGRHVVRRRESYTEKEWDEETWTSTDTERRRLRAEDDPKRAVVDIPAIVDRDQWELVQGKIKARALSTVGEMDEVLLNRGIAYCGVCGAKMVAIWHHSSQQRVYVCGRRPGLPVTKDQYCPGRYFAVPAKKVDPAIWERAQQYLGDRDKFERMLEEKAAEHDERRADAERNLATAEKFLAGMRADHAQMYELTKKETNTRLLAMYRADFLRLDEQLPEAEQRVEDARKGLKLAQVNQQLMLDKWDYALKLLEEYKRSPDMQATAREQLAEGGFDPEIHIEVMESLPARMIGAHPERYSRERKRDILRELDWQVRLHPMHYVDPEGKAHDRWEVWIRRHGENVLLSSTPDCM